MLRKRTRSNPRNQYMNALMTNSVSDTQFQSEILTKNLRNTSFLKVPGLFVGFNPGTSEFDSVRSPTSTLDFRVFSSFGNPFRLTRVSKCEGYQKKWDCDKVGLGIVESLDKETKQSGSVSQSSHGKNMIFGRQMTIRGPNVCSHVNSLDTPKSLPDKLPVFRGNRSKPVDANQKGGSGVVFEIGLGPDEPELYGNFRASSLDSGRNSFECLGSGKLVPPKTYNPTPLELGVFRGSLELGNSSRGTLGSVPLPGCTGTNFFGYVPAKEIELSEDYTCVRTYGPNPKVTHIFGDCILECPEDEISDNGAIPVAGRVIDTMTPSPQDDFLKFCYACRKVLDGEDIYMYRGEKAFCSYACRLQEIEIDEEMEKAKHESPETPTKSSSSSRSRLFIAA